MARLCSSKSQKLDVSVNENPSLKCSFKLDFPPVPSSEDLYPGMKHGKDIRCNKLNFPQNPTAKVKLRFQCHYEERKRRAEFRRKKIMQKLKKNYAIDVEGLNEDVARELIMKAEMIEKEKYLAEKRNVERMVTMISRLIEEQRNKIRGTKIYAPPWRKPLRKAPKCVEETSDKETETIRDVVGEGENSTVFMGEGEYQNKASGDYKKVAEKSTDPKSFMDEEFAGEEETRNLPVCVDMKPQVLPYRELLRRSCLSIERCLESMPRCVVFNDYRKAKVYLQDLKITNIGSEVVHCRYLGIVVHTKSEERFPVGVAVRDNVKLRPGLCCSTKIRLCSKDDTKELKCSVVYETRRQRNPLHHSWFLVPVVCVPVRAIVKIIPLKITFPSMTWCEATGTEGTKLLRKTLKIENSGGKACWCTISNISLGSDSGGYLVEIPGERGEAEGEEESIKTQSNKFESYNSHQTSHIYSEEFNGEGYLLPSGEDAEENARLLVEELFENIFAPFRFSTKYCIDIPPFSTVHTEVRFFPHYKGFHHGMYFIQFEDCDNCREQAIELVGDIKQIPLRVEPQVIDLKTCIANSGVYAGTFKIFNESKGPYSVIVKVPSSIKNHAHVYPRAATILPLNSSYFSVRVYPRVTLAMDAPRYYNENSQVLEFPVFIHPANVGACKRDRIKVYIFALITDYCLELSPSSVNFGTVTLLDSVRTELQLTNHSLAIQEYGFLNIPQGVRIEPNMGFGRILPKETITLYLLYSPGEDLIGCDDATEYHEFQVAVTSIAKYGGFREKLEPDKESAKYSDLIWGEDNGYRFSPSDVKSMCYDHLQCIQPEDSEDFDACEEESSVEGEDLYQHENKIREFLHLGGRKISENSYFKRMTPQTQDFQHLKSTESESHLENYSELGEFEDFRHLRGIYSSKPNLHIVNCRAVVVKPRCRISETVIQLPATSCSSFSLYRFRLECVKQEGDINCTCGYRSLLKCGEKEKFQCSFEFQYFCPHIKLEPESGVIKPGESLPITIKYRPEFPIDQLQHESRFNKAQKSAQDIYSKRDISQAASRTSNLKQSKGKQISAKKLTESSSKHTVEDATTFESLELHNSDFFAGEKNLAKLLNPFCVVTKLQCVIKTESCDTQSEKTEVHEMVLICPAIKPNFIYLGNSQEIKFNKVFVGTKSKVILQIQNISLERTFPSATLLNPVGPFHCSAGLKRVEVDPEHIWQQPLIYAPLEQKGIEKQFFEIYCNSTNIFLTASGEAVLPEYKITPNFACCQMEAKLGSPEEFKLEIENLSAIKLNLYLSTELMKEGPDLENPVENDQKAEEGTKTKKEKPVQKDDVTDKKKSKNSESKNGQLWEEVPDTILSMLEGFQDVSEESSEAFTLIGLNDENEIIIPPSGKQQIKVLFKPPPDNNHKTYAVKYSFKLERVSTLKEFLIVGKIFRGK